MVLDRGDGTLGAPVDGVGLDVIHPDGVASSAAVVRVHVHGAVLLVSQVGELVNADGVGVLSSGGLGVVLVDEGEVVLEGGKTLGLLDVATVVLGVLQLEL